MKYIRRHKLIQENRKGRTQKINSLNDICTIFKNNCTEYDYKYPIIYRGISNPKGLGEYAVISPSKYKRDAAYSNTTYLNLIDGSESWEDYPNRRESIICSTSRTTSSSFGDVYVVIPFDGAEFGVCNDYDFQHCFEHFYRNFGFRLHNLDSFLNIKFNATYEEIRNIIENEEYNTDLFSDSYKTYIRENNINGKEIFADMLKFTSPDINGFKISTQTEMEKGDNFGHEVWTNSDCLLVKAPYYKRFLRTIGVDEDFVDNLIV